MEDINDEFEDIHSDEIDDVPLELETKPSEKKPFKHNPKVQSTPTNPALKLNNVRDFSFKIPAKISKIPTKLQEIKEEKQIKVEEEIKEVEEKEEEIEVVEEKDEEIDEVVEEEKEESEESIEEIVEKPKKKEEKKKEEVKHKEKEKEKEKSKKSKDKSDKSDKSEKSEKSDKSDKQKKEKKKSKMPNYTEMTPAEQKKARKTFKSRFELLRDNWKNYNIPEIDDDTPLEELHEQYESYIKHIHIRENSGKYKIYMVLLWLFIELVCSKLGLPISGYTMWQLKAMNRYEKYLIKLGERNYVHQAAEESTWPIEFDLIFVALINAILLIVIKLACDYLEIGSKAEYITDTISSYLSGGQAQPVLPGNHGLPEVPQNPMNGLGNFDIPSLLSTFGTLFNNKNKNANMATDMKTPKYKPMYEE